MPSHGHTLTRTLHALAAAAFVAAMLAAGPAVSRAAKKIHVDPPPPPPTEAKAAQTFNYDHQVKKVVRDRKPVIALLRPGDTAELKDYLPFGRSDVIVTQKDNISVVRLGQADEPVLMPRPIREYLYRQLIESGEFVIVERERILEIARELALSKTQAVNPATAPRPGYLIGVHYIIEGTFRAVNGLPWDDPALENVKREINKRRINFDPRNACIMYLTAYKVETGEVKAVAVGVDLQPLVAVKRSVDDLVDQLGDIVEPIKVIKVDPETGMALLDVGSQSGAKPGDVYTLTPAGTPAGPAAAGVKAEVVEVKPLSSVVKVPPEERGSVKEGQEAHSIAPPPPPTPPAPVAKP